MIQIDERSVGAGTLYCAFSADEHYPANGGLRVMTYDSEQAARTEAEGLAARMVNKHNNYCTGFSGGKIVAAVPDLSTATLDAVIQGVSDYLNERAGQFLTGCDLNFGEREATRLAQTCTHVLAALDSEVHYADATARGVIGAVRAAIDQRNIRQPRILVHGCGAVGSRIAVRLAREMSVATFDILPSRADLPRCTNISHAEWSQHPTDILVLVSASRIINEVQLSRLAPQAVVCGANIPFVDDYTEAWVRQSCLLIDEGIASAGAVIADSIEYYAPEKWRTVAPERIYAFIEQQVYNLSRGRREKVRIPLANGLEYTPTHSSAYSRKEHFIGQRIQ